MKRIILLSIILFAFKSYSQNLDFSQLNEITKISSKYFSYTDSKGTVIKIGDTLNILKPETDNNFTHVYFGNDIAGYQHVSRIAMNKKVVLETIRVTKQNRNAQPNVTMRCVEGNMLGGKYVINWEQAINTGEAKKAGVLTKDEALKILEQKKKELDLGLISNEEYQSLLEKLKPVIMDN